MRNVRVQLDYLRRFAEQIISGKQRLDGTLRRRAELYVLSARTTYHEVRLRVDQETGKTEERNLLSGTEHCRDSKDRAGCQEQTDRGWVPIGTLVPIGQRTCLARCHCRVERR